MSNHHGTRNALAKSESEQNAGTGAKCRTCWASTNKDKVYECVGCGDKMHLTKACTGMSVGVIEAIEEISSNLMLLCNECVKNNQRE